VGNELVVPSLAGTTAWYFLSKVLPGLSGAVMIAAQLRLLGVQEYFLIARALPIVLIVSGVATAWLRQGLLRLYPDDRPTPGSVVAIIVKPAFGCGVVAGCIGLAVLGNLTDAVIVAMLSAALAGTATYGTLLQMHRRAKKFAVVETVRSVVGLIGAVAPIVMVETSARISLIGFAAAQLLAAGYGMWDSGRFLLDRSQASGTALLASEWGFSLWVGIAFLFQYVDRYMLEVIRSVGEAAEYAAAYDLINRGVGLVIFPLVIAVHPEVSSLWLRDQHRARRMLKRSIAIQSAMGGAVIALLVGIWPYGAQLANLSPALVLPVLLVASATMWQVSQLAHKPLELCGSVSHMLLGIGVALIVNVVGNLAVLDWLGGAGAAGMSLVGGLVYVAMMLKYWASRSGVR
jgi:O-antigen/teichoic acid export membrane protein